VPHPHLSRPRVAGLTVLALLAFAGNSLLCRLALTDTDLDEASFTSLRLVSGAAMLGLLVYLSSRPGTPAPSSTAAGSWTSALALFAYAALLSFAYVGLDTATGALLLFGAVQATMIGYGLWRGERMNRVQSLGLALALGGLAGLFAPGLTAPSGLHAVLMLASGAAWGIYSLLGRGVQNPLATTAGNFLRTVPLTLALSLVLAPHIRLDTTGALYALASGAITSGLGYAIWYSALPAMKATTAATVQLSVPVLAALGGVVFVREPLTLHLVLASVAILGGIALVIRFRTR